MAGSIYSTIFGGGGGGTQGSTTFAENSTLTLGTGSGCKVGGNANQKLGAWGATPIVQPSGTGELVGMNGNAVTAAQAANMNANGNNGTKYYTLNDVVKALKAAGWLAAS